jgi:hypothetical protein
MTTIRAFLADLGGVHPRYIVLLAVPFNYALLFPNRGVYCAGGGRSYQEAKQIHSMVTSLAIERHEFINGCIETPHVILYMSVLDIYSVLL